MASGDAKSDFWWLILMLAILGVAWFVTGGPSNPESRKPFIELPAPLGSGATSYIAPSYPTNPSPEGHNYNSQISVSSGNAFYEVYPNQEYIVLTAASSNPAPVDITGWSLVNNGRRLLKGAVIPGGDKLFIAGAPHRLAEHIFLAPGEQAIIVTGHLPSAAPIAIDTNFKVNKCSGYLADLPDYRFSPALWSNCPLPREEQIVAQLNDQDCYLFVKRLGSCHTPETKIRENLEYTDGVALSGFCRDFVKSQFNYNSCVNRHYGDSDFWGKEWRVYLNQSDELWASDRETITLYDKNNKIVAQNSY